MDVPNERSSHTRPTPRGGGLGIVIVVLGAWLLSGDRGPADWMVVMAAIVVAAVSWFDDRRGVPFVLRLTIHLLAAAAAVAVLGPIEQFWVPGVGAVSVGLLGWPLTVVWIVGLVNAYNFMDGIDGIAGGQGMVAGLAWTCIGIAGGSPSAVTLGSLIAVTCGVFLLFNWSPARIFLGDVGSATLGYLLAVLPLIVVREVPASDQA
ncbi:MAG: undecaprenyl/decaprenyl-phosphate alpha-N-acetylglucosaminyl 1-phosphate transferase, partial [Gemmatimonadales bacterium]